MKSKIKVVEVRNFVAKNAPKVGAGRHKDKKSDYRRQPKHRNQQTKKGYYAEN